MRQLFVLLLSFLFLHGVRAVPLEERQLLEPLESLVTSLFDIAPTPTPTPADPDDGPSKPTPTPKDDPKDDPKDKDDTTTIDEPAVQTTTTSESSSSEPTTTSSSSSISSTTTSSASSASSTTSASPIPTNPLTAAETPTSSKKDSSSGITPAGIAVAIIMSLAILLAIFLVIWKFHPKVVAWRRKKAYERMQERSYRPALDGFLPTNTSNEKGLGLSNMEKTRPLSLWTLASPRHNTIRRKPLPQAVEYPAVEMPRLEKELPARPPDYARAMP